MTLCAGTFLVNLAGFTPGYVVAVEANEGKNSEVMSMSAPSVLSPTIPSGESVSTSTPLRTEDNATTHTPTSLDTGRLKKQAAIALISLLLDLKELPSEAGMKWQAFQLLDKNQKVSIGIVVTSDFDLGVLLLPGGKTTFLVAGENIADVATRRKVKDEEVEA